MKAYNINGTEKTITTTCNDCDNGENYLHLQSIIKTDSEGLDYTEVICGSCMSLYKIPKKITPLIDNTEEPIKITTEQIQLFNETILTKENLTLYALQISENYKDQPQIINIKTKTSSYQLLINTKDEIRLIINKSTYQNKLINLLNKIITTEENEKEQADRLTPVQVQPLSIKFDLTTTKVKKSE